MIIVSQNKQMILNFNRISYLSIGENHKGNTDKKDFKYSIYADDTKNIGDYPTLDRAKEVLKDIYTSKGKEYFELQQE